MRTKSEGGKWSIKVTQTNCVVYFWALISHKLRNLLKWNCIEENKNCDVDILIFSKKAFITLITQLNISKSPKGRGWPHYRDFVRNSSKSFLMAQLLRRMRATCARTASALVWLFRTNFGEKLFDNVASPVNIIM